MKALIFTDYYSASIAAAVGRHPDVEPVVVSTAREFISELRDAEAVFCRPAQVSDDVADAIRSAGSLRWIQALTSGIDALAKLRGDLDRLIVTNVAAAYGDAVAEHAVALALALLRGVPALVEAKAARQWIKTRLGREIASLEGARVTVLGLGAIGQALVRRLHPFNCAITVVRRTSGKLPAGLPGDVRQESLDAALQDTDLLFVSVPLTDETKGLIGERRLALLPAGARLVNVARGEVVNARALAAALDSGHLSAAALDVFDREPLEPASELWDVPNLLISPHVSGRGNRLVETRIVEICEANLHSFMRGELRSSPI
ncbi:NAD(P)-dependent oxidoreductase [Pseudochelatococcus sp. B33]